MTAVLSLAAILFLFLLIHGRNQRVTRKGQRIAVDRRPLVSRDTNAARAERLRCTCAGCDPATAARQDAQLIPVALWRSRQPFNAQADDALAIGAPAEVDELSKRRKA